MEIVCKKCSEKQHWMGQLHCMNPQCSDRLSQWSIASQLEAKAKVKVYTNNDHEADGA